MAKKKRKTRGRSTGSTSSKQSSKKTSKALAKSKKTDKKVNKIAKKIEILEKQQKKVHPVQQTDLVKPQNNEEAKPQKPKYPILPSGLRKMVWGIVMFLISLIIAASVFGFAGKGGETILNGIDFVIGRTAFFVPFLFLLTAFLIMKPQRKRLFAPVSISLSLLILGISGILSTQDVTVKGGGWLGYLAAYPFFNYFNTTIGIIVFSTLTLIGVLILWEFFPKKKKQPFYKKKKAKAGQDTIEQKPEKKKPRFEIKPIDLKGKKKIFISKTEPTITKTQPITAKEEAEDYKRPPLSVFDTTQEKPASGDVDYNAAVIKKTFNNFGIDVEMSEVNIGPTVTQYTMKPAEGVKLSKIIGLNNDLALALAAHPIRIEAPIPGRSLVGVEVPNKIRANIKVGSLIASQEFQNSASRLSFTLGTDVMGKLMLPDLGRMPHLLVAGATGSGKTICLHSLIMSLIYRNAPKFLRLILIDPKRVEFPVFAALPHLLTPVILNARKAVNALNWLVGEMERRFDVLREQGSRDIDSYNKVIEKKIARSKEPSEDLEIMPYIVLIIDELADLMMSKGKEVEMAIVRLSQLARAVGIHLVVATQRPSVEVITGLIKANITSRVAFQVASQIDSRTILDTAGAEKLLGRGDMLFISAEFSRPKRIQGSFITLPETKKAVDFIVKENATEAQEEISEDSERGAENLPSGGLLPSSAPSEEIANFAAKDELYEDAKEVVVQYQKASASLLQRRLQVGYARAARMIDMLEENGIVGPQEGSRPREILLASTPPLGELDKTEAGGRESPTKKDGGFEDAGKIEFDYK